MTDHELEKLAQEKYPISPFSSGSGQTIDVSILVIGAFKAGYKAAQSLAVMDKDEITYAALQEAIVCGHDRNCWLVFGTGIKHVETITAMLNYLGITARCKISKSFPMVGTGITATRSMA